MCYFSTDMPMIDKCCGLHGMKKWSVVEVTPGLSLDGNMPPYIVQTAIYWDSVDDLQKALGAPESKETSADVASFSDIYAVIWVREVQGTRDLYDKRGDGLPRARETSHVLNSGGPHAMMSRRQRMRMSSSVLTEILAMGNGRLSDVTVHQFGPAPPQSVQPALSILSALGPLP